MYGSPSAAPAYGQPPAGQVAYAGAAQIGSHHAPSNLAHAQTLAHAAAVAAGAPGGGNPQVVEEHHFYTVSPPQNGAVAQPQAHQQTHQQHMLYQQQQHPQQLQYVEQQYVQQPQASLRPCTKCQQPIPRGQPMVTAGGGYFHQQCFTCSRCASVINDLRYKIDPATGNTVLCLGCSTQACAACGHGIQGPTLMTCDQPYHPECFCCHGCGGNIVGEYEVVDNQTVLCGGCAAKRCVTCSRVMQSGEQAFQGPVGLVCQQCAQGQMGQLPPSPQQQQHMQQFPTAPHSYPGQPSHRRV